MSDIFSKIFDLSKERTVFYYSALIFAFIFPLSRAAISFFLLWFFILFLYQGDYKRIWSFIQENRLLQVMGIFLLYLAVSFLWSEDRSEALNQIRLYSYWIIIPILAMNLKKEWLPSIITAFLIGMFVSEIIAYGIYFEWWSINGRGSDYPTPFMSHIHYSVFLATTAMILFSRLLSNRYTWRSKLPMLLFFFTSTGNLMISTGRTGQLAFLIAMAVAVIIHYRLTLKSLIIFSVASSILFIGAYSTIDLFKQRFDMGINDVQQLQNNNFETSWGQRAVYWVVTADIIKTDPLMGVGIGDYKQVAEEVLEQNNHNFSLSTITICKGMSHYHNQYLMILAQLGLIGFTLMIWLLFQLFTLRIKDPDLKEFSVLSLTIFAVGSIAEPLWMLQFPIILFVFAVSISLSASDGAATQN